METSMKNNMQYKQGFSLVEMLIYVAILSLIVSALVLTATSLLRTLAYMQTTSDITEAATVAIERITREIRFADAVNTGASTLGTHPGTLVMSSIDENDNPTTVTISVSGGRIMFAEGSEAAAPLTHAGITISNLTFTHFTSTETEAVRVELTVEKNLRSTTISKQFRTFVVLDAS